MRETARIDRIRKLAAAGPTSKLMVRGIGDDCAIVRPRSGHDLVFTSDFLLEGRHFTLDTHKADDVGHKALARSLSDLAAMGASPVFCLVSLGVPSALGQKWVERFYKGLLGLAASERVTLAGGDLAQFARVIVDVTCCGEPPRGKALLRSGAKAGDRIYVTGQLGSSANGLSTGRGRNFRRHLRPQPRVEVGLALCRLRVSACMDISDGLALDLHRLCLESGLSAELNDDIPVARGASLEDALHGGEDYELLFTAPPRIRIPSELAGVSVAAMGTLSAGAPGELWFRHQPLAPGGFDHFA